MHHYPPLLLPLVIDLVFCVSVTDYWERESEWANLQSIGAHLLFSFAEAGLRVVGEASKGGRMHLPGLRVSLTRVYGCLWYNVLSSQCLYPFSVQWERNKEEKMGFCGRPKSGHNRE